MQILPISYLEKVDYAGGVYGLVLLTFIAEQAQLGGGRSWESTVITKFMSRSCLKL
jgi:hypothetical protein